MADIGNRKYYSYITDTEAPDSYPPSWETPQGPVNPPSQGGGTGTISGTKDQIAKFLSPLNIGDSKASEDGTTFYMEDLELRIGTLDNLGTTPTNVLVPSGTGVVKIRTLAQFKDDLGVISIPLPDGVVIQGGAVQTGNDIEYDTVWVWRLSSTEYQLPANDTITFPSAASGKIRIDLTVATSSNTIYRVAGTEVNDTETAVAPSVPAGTVALQQVFITDVGIDSFEDFALATFVRFDIPTQGLNSVQRRNARINIQALSKDTDDTRTGSLVNNGFIEIDDERAGGSALRIEKDSNSNSNNLLVMINNIRGTVFKVTSYGNTYIYAQLEVTSPFVKGIVVKNGSGTENMTLNTDGTIFQARSSDADESTRRDELGFNYYENNGDAGPLNDLAIEDDTKLLRIGIATELTGVVPATTNRGRLIRIEADSVTLTVKDEDSNSSANNRFALGSDLVINSGEVYQFIYTNSRWRRCQ